MLRNLLFIICITIIINLANLQLNRLDLVNYFYSKSNSVLGFTVDISNPKVLTKVGFSKNKDTIFIIHGYLEMPTSIMSTSQEIKNAILAKHDVNVIVLNYGNPLVILYPVAVQQVKEIGNSLAALIKSMQKNNGLDLKKTKLIGVSLGAHIAGVAGEALGGEVDELIGLDPAGPLFTRNTPTRLSKSSAKFVHVVHTNGGGLGNIEPLGHADYYVNGGSIQPACGQIPVGICPHGLSVGYYVESLKNGIFKATKCDSYVRFKNRKCDSNEKSWMGGYNLDRKAHGLYFLDTNKTPPYAKG